MSDAGLQIQRSDAPVAALRALKAAGVDVSAKMSVRSRPRLWAALVRSPALARSDKIAIMYYIDLHSKAPSQKASVDLVLCMLAMQMAAAQPDAARAAAREHSVPVTFAADQS